MPCFQSAQLSCSQLPKDLATTTGPAFLTACSTKERSRNCNQNLQPKNETAALVQTPISAVSADEQ